MHKHTEVIMTGVTVKERRFLPLPPPPSIHPSTVMCSSSRLFNLIYSLKLLIYFSSNFSLDFFSFLFKKKHQAKGDL